MKSRYYVLAFAAAAWLLMAGCGGKSDPGETAAADEEKAAETAEADGPEGWFSEDPEYPRNPNTEQVSVDELLVPCDGGKRAENVVVFAADRYGRVNGPCLALASIDGRSWAYLGVEGESPQFSPDGKKIAYLKNRYSDKTALCVINADGSGETVLFDEGDYWTDFTFTPDSRAVVYCARIGERPYEHTGGLFLADVAGRDRRLIYSSEKSLNSPSLPASGNKIVFESSYEIYVINIDGSGFRRVTGPPVGPEYRFDKDPTISPDGSKIAFRSGDDYDHELGYDVYVVNADGTGRHNLTADDTRDETPTFSPDGKRIVFNSWEGGITVADVNTFELRRVPTTGGGGLHEYLTARFSPDGRKIAYDAPYAENTSTWQIYIINADGTGNTWVSPGGKVSYVRPYFSPMRVDGVLLDTYGRVVEE
jgi:dipeptidyl aminopeptidase/acylaminoacyl peptidase